MTTKISVTPAAQEIKICEGDSRFSAHVSQACERLAYCLWRRYAFLSYV